MKKRRPSPVAFDHTVLFVLKIRTEFDHKEFDLLKEKALCRVVRPKWRKEDNEV